MKSLLFYLIFLPIFTLSQISDSATFVFDSRHLKESGLFNYSALVHSPRPPLDSIELIIPYRREYFDSGLVAIRIPCPSAGSVLIADFLYHQVYIEPGDTVWMELEKVNDLMAPIGVGYNHTWSVFYNYKGAKAAQHGFFDSLVYEAGAVHGMAHSVRNSAFNFGLFLDSAQRIYERRIDYLNNYAQRHIISAGFFSFAKKEIYFSYLHMILNSLQFPQIKWQRDSLDKRLVALLDNFDYNDTTYINASSVYFKLLTSYIAVWKTDYNALKHEPAVHAAACFDFAMGHLKGKSLPMALTHFLRSEIANGRLPDISNMQQYEVLAKGGIGNGEVLAMYEALANIRSDISFVYREKVLDVLGDTLQFKEIIGNGKPSVIDIWASWCAPCIEQFPYMDSIMAKFEDRVNFITLSFDMQSAAWHKGLKTHGLKAQNAYWMPMHFNTPFAKYFSLNAIPRYLVFNQAGEVANNRAPHPIEQALWEDLLNKLL
jgi:thiol-disulfide isomerase/thioredoxin